MQPMRMPKSNTPTATQTAMMIVRVWGSIPPVLESELGVAEATEVDEALAELLAGVELDEANEVVDGVEVEEEIEVEAEVVIGVLVGSRLDARPAAAEMTPPKLMEL